MENTEKELVANSLKMAVEQLYRKVIYLKRSESIHSNVQYHPEKSIRKLRSLLSDLYENVKSTYLRYKKLPVVVVICIWHTEANNKFLQPKHESQHLRVPKKHFVRKTKYVYIKIEK